MSMENEGADPTDPTDPTGLFDAFRARQADDREQQETQAGYGYPAPEPQAGYTFPPEYTQHAADPDAAYVPPLPSEPPTGGGIGDRLRSMVIFAAALLVAGALGLGAWLAFDSSSPSANTASTGTAGIPTPAATGTGTAARALTFRVTIASVGAASFTGTALANGEPVTVTLTAKTRFGTKAHAFTRGDLTVGETVIVRGRRTGTDTITATEVAANVADPKKSSATASAAAGSAA